MFEFGSNGVPANGKLPSLDETLQQSIGTQQQNNSTGTQHPVSLVNDNDEIFDQQLQLNNQPQPQPGQKARHPEPINDVHTASTVLGAMKLDTSKPLSSKLGRFLSAPLAFFRGLGVGGAKGAVAGAAAGAVGGAIAGAAGGTAVLPIAGSVAGAAAGSAAGAVGGAAIGLAGKGIYDAGKGFFNEARHGDMASTLFSSGKRPQDAHGQAAVNSLVHSGWEPNPAELNKLGQVSADQWKSLLHVPKQYKLTPSWASSGVKGRENRQKIREAVVLFVAKHGHADAAAYRARLIRAARSNPQTLHDHCTAFKAGVVRDRLKTIEDTLAGDAKTAAISQLIRRNPEIFTRPSLLHQIEPFAGKADHYGLESALGVVDRIQARGVISAQDNIDLNRAINASGLDENTLFTGDKADLKDVLKPYVGKPMTPAIKHKIAQAIYRQFGDSNGGLAVNISGQERNELQSVMDPKRFQSRLDQNQIPKLHNEDLAGRPSFDERAEHQQSAHADHEIKTLEALSRHNLNNFKQQVVRDVGNSLHEVHNRFETPSQQTQRIQQEKLLASQQVVKTSLDEQQDLQRLTALRDDYAPDITGNNNGAEFDRIKNVLGLNDNEFDAESLRKNVTSQFRNTFGSYGDKLPASSDHASTKRMAEDATLRAISGHLGTASMTGNSLVNDERRDEIQRLCEQYQNDGLPQDDI